MEDNMKEKLLALHKNSYAAYSNFPVSSIVVTKDGREFSGVNVEDASYRAGACAERVAIFSASDAIDNINNIICISVYPCQIFQANRNILILNILSKNFQFINVHLNLFVHRKICIMKCIAMQYHIFDTNSLI